MDLNVWISALLATSCWIFCSVRSAPAAPTPSAGSPPHHVRNRRCSCATFLDKECVYFCHLDIIWVNTPERVVSYGLGNAPRARRALADSMATSRAPRCQCHRENDGGCTSFCLRYDTEAETLTGSPEDAGCGTRCKRARTGGDTSGTESTRISPGKPVWPAALRSVLRTRLLLETWRMRRRHRTRSWQDKGSVS
ncbi:endothelin-1 [Melanotaenia boesemani]|uniref:endothelin-1 n=1 Tax=Melanotaenia boesemani TaxID=1250792 RepID=UPI001C05AC24|nr:endothelin-1 [Melanotaenia boesemani]